MAKDVRPAVTRRLIPCHGHDGKKLMECPVHFGFYFLIRFPLLSSGLGISRLHKTEDSAIQHSGWNRMEDKYHQAIASMLGASVEVEALKDGPLNDRRLIT